MELPIFPLNGAILFPETSLPLNIFEKRYLDMIDYALSKNRSIGMIQENENKKLYEIGCVGKINSFNETNDGRYLISLYGSNYFKVKNETNKKFKFRIVNAEILKNKTNGSFSFSDEKKDLLLQRYLEYINFKKIKMDLTEIKNIDVSQLIKFITMISPFDDIDKQALLETFDINNLYDKLITILEIETFEKTNQKKIN